jgi:hypothetical protein
MIFEVLSRFSKRNIYRNKIKMIMMIAILTIQTKQEVAGTDVRNYNQSTMNSERIFERNEIYHIFERDTINHLMLEETDILRRDFEKRLGNLYARMSNFEKFINSHEQITMKTNEALGGLQDEIEEIKYDQLEYEKERKKLLERVEQDEASSVITQNHNLKRMNLIEERPGRLRRPSIHPPNTAYKMPKKREDPDKSHGRVEIYNSFSQNSGGLIQEKEEALMDENAKLMNFDAMRNESRETLGGNLYDTAPIPEMRKKVRIGPGPNTIVIDPTHHFGNDFQGNL